MAAGRITSDASTVAPELPRAQVEVGLAAVVSQDQVSSDTAVITAPSALAPQLDPKGQLGSLDSPDGSNVSTSGKREMILAANIVTAVTAEELSLDGPPMNRRASSIAGEDEDHDVTLDRKQNDMAELFRLLHVSEDVLLDIAYLIENSDRRVLGSTLSQMDRKLFNVVDDMEEE